MPRELSAALSAGIDCDGSMLMVRTRPIGGASAVSSLRFGPTKMCTYSSGRPRSLSPTLRQSSAVPKHGQPYMAVATAKATHICGFTLRYIVHVKYQRASAASTYLTGWRVRSSHARIRASGTQVISDQIRSDQIRSDKKQRDDVIQYITISLLTEQE